MASVGESVRKSITDWSSGDLEFAMLHACNAVDGTAKKAYGGTRVGERFKKLIRSNYDVLGPMGMPGIDIQATKWPVILDSKEPYKLLDLAEIIYRVHRCTHGHGDELPAGWELYTDVGGESRSTRTEWHIGKVSLSDRIIFGLLAIAVLAEKNYDQKVPDGFFLSFDEQHFMINEWWGRKSDFLSSIEGRVQLIPCVTIDFREWMIRSA